ncbi:MAG TPA: 50S ribosomal protein L29 [Actinomycetes bacterium]|nr:50S ribosomal protein L29 [Actinomycetes bacterium]
MKASELTQLAPEELAEKLAEAKEELFNLRFQNVTGQLDNPNRLGEVRRDIARILTVLRERELAGEDMSVAARAHPVSRRSGRRLGRRRRRG